MTGKQALDWLKKQNRRQNNGNGDLWLEMYINAFEKDLDRLEVQDRIINECIDLLEISGRNTKQKVLEKLRSLKNETNSK